MGHVGCLSQELFELLLLCGLNTGDIGFLLLFFILFFVKDQYMKKIMHVQFLTHFLNLHHSCIYNRMLYIMFMWVQYTT